MEAITLEIAENTYPNAKSARADGRIPIIYYGKGVENRRFSVDYQDFRRAYEKGGRSTIMHLVTDKKEEFPVLVHEIQYDPVSDQMLHIDVKAVDLNKPIQTKVPLMLTGVSPAVKDLAGVLVQNKDSVEVECLPKDLIYQIEVDISSLEDFHTSITVGDIKVPGTIKILDAPDINVATVTAPRITIEEEEAAEAAEAEAAEVEGEEKAEGEAPAEGEEKAEAKEEGKEE